MTTATLGDMGGRVLAFTRDHNRAPEDDTPALDSILQRASGEQLTGAKWIAEREEMNAVLRSHKLGDGGSLTVTPLAVTVILQWHPYWRGCIRHNELAGPTGAPECGKKAIDKSFQAQVRLWFESHMRVRLLAREDISDAYAQVARLNSYHPVKRYLDSLPAWDGNPRVENLVMRLGAPMENWPLYQAYLKAWTIGAVRRVYEPGCQMDSMLVLYGKQGVRKSSFFSELVGAPGYNQLTDSQWSNIYAIHGAWVHEYAELETITTKADVGRIKAHITTRSDNAALKYEPHVSYLPRKFVFCGTTNRDDFLRDETGARRFWIIACGAAIDTDYVRANRDQIWAEALHLYRAGEACWLTDAGMQSDQERLAAEYLPEDDPWTEAVQAYVETHQGEALRTTAILDRIDVDFEKRTRVDSLRVASIMRALGYASKVVRIGAGTARRWVKDELG